MKNFIRLAKHIFWVYFLICAAINASELPDSIEIIVKIKQTTDSSILSRILQNRALAKVKPSQPKRLFFATKNISQKLEESPLKQYFKIKIADASQLSFVLAQLQESGLVEYAAIPRSFRIYDYPNDPRFAEQWYITKIHADKAWQITTGDSAVIIAIIDTGIDYLHEDLKSNLWINKAEDLNGNGAMDSSDFNGIDDDENGFVDDVIGWDFTDAPHFPDNGDYLNPDNDPADEHGHGTLVAGIIAATANNGKGIAGIAHNCTILTLRAGTAQGYLEEDDVAAAIIYAIDNGARIINMSFGDVATSPLFRDVMKFAYENNIVLVGSAGNTSSPEINYPAAFPQVISVGALTSSNALASFSSYGATIDLVAPGVQLISTARNGNYSIFSGTSAAAPVVSAVAGLILSQNPDLANQNLRNLLVSTATDLGKPGWDERFGAGRIDALKPLQVRTTSEAKIDFPKFDQGFVASTIPIIGTAAGVYLAKYEILFGTGDNPQQWFSILTVQNKQVISDTLGFWNLNSLPDSTFILRLRVQNLDGSAIENRVRIRIDNSSPVLLSISQSNMLDGANQSQLIQFTTDDVTQAKIFYRQQNSAGAFQEIDLHYETKEHRYLFSMPGAYEFYLQIKNCSGLITDINDDGNYFKTFLTDPPVNVNRFSQWQIKLPSLYLLNKIVDFDKDGNPEFVALPYDPRAGYGNLDLYEFEGDKFQEIEIMPNVFIPRDIADIDFDGFPELLLGVGPVSIILSGNALDPIPREIVWADSNDCWASRFADLDNDGQVELIARKFGKYRIFKIEPDFQLQEIAEMPNPTSGSNFTGVPHTEVGDFDNDSKTEILFGDGDGDIYLYEYVGNEKFVATWQQELPLEDATNFLSSGDFDGDGIPEFAAGCHSSSNLDLEHEYDGRYWLVRIFDSAANDSFSIVWEQRFFGFADPSDFPSSFSAGDIDNDGDDELLLNLFPDFYVIDYDAQTKEFNAIGYLTPSQSHANLIADLDGNGENEFLLNTGKETLIFQDRYASQTLQPTAPAGFDAYPLDESHVFLKWLPDSSASKYRVYRGNAANNLQLLTETQWDTLIDADVAAGEKYYYAISSLFSTGNFPESQLSPIISVVPGEKPYLKSAEFYPPNQLRIFFSEKMNETITDPANYVLGEFELHPESVIRDRNFQAAILTFSSAALPPGTYSLIVRNVQDADRTPIDMTKNSATFSVPEIPEKFYIENAEMSSDGKILVRFNLPVEEKSASQKENYSFEPPLPLESARVDELSSNLVILTIAKNITNFPLNNEFVLTVQNIFSNSGIPIVQSAGSQVAIYLTATTLSNAIVFPNPFTASLETNFVTFSNLIKGTAVKILSSDGRMIRSLRDESNNGTIQWDLKDENGNDIGSGVYIFYLKYSDQQCVGKIAVIR